MKNNIIKGEPLRPNIQIEKRVVKQLENLTEIMTKEVQKELIKLFKNESPKYFATDMNIVSQARILINALKNKYSKMFDLKGTLIMEKMVKDVDRHSKASIKSSVKKLTGGTVIDVSTLSQETKNTLKAGVLQASSYIASIQERFLTDVAGYVYRSITEGEGLKDLVPNLEKLSGQTKRRAKLIALDQTRKVTATLDEARLKKLGINKWIWNHSGGSMHPRETHLEFDGKVFSFDELPYDSMVKKRVDVGELPYCRCFRTPVIELDEN